MNQPAARSPRARFSLTFPFRSRPPQTEQNGLLADICHWTLRLLALAVLIIYAPALFAAGMLVALTSPGPAFVRREYLRASDADALFRNPVSLYEIRTECAVTLRPTPVGQWVRRLHLHRLPRLLHVWQGEIRAGESLERC